MSEDRSVLRECEVLSVDDPQGGGRIKVRMIPEDNNAASLDDIPYAFPLLPKILHVKPKVGEAVYVIPAVTRDGFSQRVYLGPIISQLPRIEKDDYATTALSMFPGAYYTPSAAASQNPETEGAYPNDDDIAILGRRNTDIQIKPNDIRIRAGVKKSSPVNRYSSTFNKKNPAYLKLKYHEDKSDNDEYKSTATLVADRINLIGNNSKEYFNTTDKTDLVTDSTMDEIMKKAHQLPYGDILIEFLDKLRKEVMTHTHPFPTLPPCSTESMVNIGTYNLKDMLSDSVRIN